MWKDILTLCIPVIVALIPVIPTIISNRRAQNKAFKQLQESIDEQKKTLNDHIRHTADTNARAARIRILRFNDELCDKKKHSESYYEDILEDIDLYEEHCAKHPDFKNNRGKFAMENVKNTYYERKKTGDFLSN